MNAPGRTTPAPSAPEGNGHARMDMAPDENPATSAAKQAAVYFSEIKAYATHFMTAKVDGLKATGKRLALYAVLGLVGAVVGVGILLSAAFLLLSGLAMGLGILFGHRLWLGQLTVGVLVLAGTGLGVWIVLKKITEASRKQTEQKYESKRNQQRVDFGHDVHQRAGK